MSSKLIASLLLALLATETNAQVVRTPTTSSSAVSVTLSSNVTLESGVSGGRTVTINATQGGTTRTFTSGENVSGVSSWATGVANSIGQTATTKATTLGTAVSNYNSGNYNGRDGNNTAVTAAYDDLNTFLKDTRGVVDAVRGVGIGATPGLVGAYQSFQASIQQPATLVSTLLLASTTASVSVGATTMTSSRYMVVETLNSTTRLPTTFRIREGPDFLATVTVSGVSLNTDGTLNSSGASITCASNRVGYTCPNLNATCSFSGNTGLCLTDDARKIRATVADAMGTALGLNVSPTVTACSSAIPTGNSCRLNATTNDTQLSQFNGQRGSNTAAGVFQNGRDEETIVKCVPGRSLFSC